MAALASRQHGAAAHWQLLRLGLSPSAIQRMVQAGRLHPVFRGVYAVGHSALSHLGRRMAAVLACGPGAVLSHQPAADLLALRRSSSPIIHVTVPGRTRRGPEGIRVHRVRRLHPDDVAEWEGIPVTSVPRTLLDLAEVVDMRQLIRAIEQAERLRLFDLRATEELIVRSHGRRGIKPLRKALTEMDGEPPTVRSDWERDFLDFCADFGLPRPELNAIVEGYEVDALWRDAKVIVELDSYAFHRSRGAFEEDRVRDAVLQLAGYLVLRITWRRLETEPRDVAEMLSAAVAAR
jgi:hypothetical protein